MKKQTFVIPMPLTMAAPPVHSIVCLGGTELPMFNVLVIATETDEKFHYVQLQLVPENPEEPVWILVSGPGAPLKYALGKLDGVVMPAPVAEIAQRSDGTWAWFSCIGSAFGLVEDREAAMAAAVSSEAEQERLLAAFNQSNKRPDWLCEEAWLCESCKGQPFRSIASFNEKCCWNCGAEAPERMES